MKKESKIWFEKAKRDLHTARNNLNSGDYYAASFFAQQSVEKGLKALQLKLQKTIIKTHDLLFLSKKLKVPKTIVEKCDKLNPIYIETRYPDANSGFKEYSAEESEKDINLAGEVLSWIEKKI